MEPHPPASGSKKVDEHPSPRGAPVSFRWILTGMISLVGFLVITVLVVTQVAQIPDAKFAIAINQMNIGPELSSLTVNASVYGREYFWVPVVAILLIFGKKDTKMLAIELAILFILGIIAGEAMKFVMFRARPFETLSGIITRVPTDTDSSYPSGHALIVSIGAIFSLAKFRKKGIALALALEAVIVCYSRVYVGMHYPLDVISAVFLASFIVFTGVYVLERSSYLKKILDAINNIATKIARIGFFSV